ncbi:MAG: PhoH family protein [Burkholderiaceae bacterium]
MPLPKSPSRMGQILDLEEASRQKAKPPARPRGAGGGSAPGAAAAPAALPTSAMSAPPTPAMTALPTSTRTVLPTPTMTAPPAAATTVLPATAATARPATAAGARGAANAPASTAADSDAPASAPGRRPSPAPRPLAAVLSAPASVPGTDRARLAPAPGTLRITDTPPPGRPNGGGARNGRAPVTVLRTSARKQAEKRRAAAERSLFVVDTNVLMHDPTALFRFQEHDIYLPMMTLEELDTHKRGMSEVSRNARQVSRTLDSLIAATDAPLEQGVALSRLGNIDATGRLYVQTEALSGDLPAALPIGKADNQILSVVSALSARESERKVVLVSKDINMRIKAHALGLAAEDYFSDQVTDDLDLMYAGWSQLPLDFWDTHGKAMESWQQQGYTYYRITGPLVPTFRLNQFVSLDGDLPLLAQVRELNGRTAVLQTIKDYAHHKNAIWGITARNREQNFALNLLMNPEIDFVSLLGQAGTGKTLLALAAALAQTLDHKRFAEIIMTRATVPVGDDIGYLPGTEEEKMQPWMGALEDNLEVLNQGTGGGGEGGRAAASDLIRSRIRVKALSFMRGRTFINKYLIIDEAQNLTPKQMKTLVTRAGVGTKVVCLGNIAQIDTPYLTEASSGLTYVVERFKGWAHSGHVTLQRGERSRLADFATDAL